MNLDEAVKNIRGRLDDEIQDYLWSDYDLISYINQRRNEFARRTGFYRDSTTAAICTLTMVGSQANYALDERVISIKRAKPSWSTAPLVKRSCQFMDDNVSGWEDSGESATPYVWIPDKQMGYVTIYPTPTTTIGTVQLTVSRLPLVQLSLSSLKLAVPTGLEFPLMWQENLIDGVLASCYGKPDSQTRDPQKASYHLSMWERFITLDVVQHMTKEFQSDEPYPDSYSIYNGTGVM